jgi:hypothetical protein
LIRAIKPAPSRDAPVSACQHLREFFDVAAQGVQVRAGSPHLLELELLVGVEMVAGACLCSCR